MKNKNLVRYMSYWVIVIALVIVGVAICYGVEREPPATPSGIFTIGIMTGMVFTLAYFWAWQLISIIVKYLWAKRKGEQVSFLESLGGKG